MEVNHNTNNVDDWKSVKGYLAIVPRTGYSNQLPPETKHWTVDVEVRLWM